MIFNLIVSNFVKKNWKTLIFEKNYKVINYYNSFRHYNNFIISSLIKKKLDLNVNFFTFNRFGLILAEYEYQNVYYKRVKKLMYFKLKSKAVAFDNFRIKLDIVSFLLLLYCVEPLRRLKYNEYICNGVFLSIPIASNLVKISYFDEFLTYQLLNIKHLFYYNYWNNNYIIFYFKAYANFINFTLNKFYFLYLVKNQSNFILYKYFMLKYVYYFLIRFSKNFISYFFYKFIMFRGRFASWRFVSKLKYFNYKDMLNTKTKYGWRIRMFRFFLFLKTWYLKTFVTHKQFLLDFYNYKYSYNSNYRFYYNIILILMVKSISDIFFQLTYPILLYEFESADYFRNFVKWIMIKFIHIKQKFYTCFLTQYDIMLWRIYESDIFKSFFVNSLTLSNYFRKLDFDILVKSRIVMFFFYSRLIWKFKMLMVSMNFSVLFVLYFFHSISILFVKNSVKYFYVFDQVMLSEYYFGFLMLLSLSSYYTLYWKTNKLSHYATLYKTPHKTFYL